IRFAYFSFGVVRLPLGVLLLTAAGLKAHSLLTGANVYESLVPSPHLQIATIEMETLLGLWLLSGWAVRPAWAVALGVVGIMAAVSLSLALDGQASCGCFGKVEVHPWWTFGLDLAAVVALLIGRPGAEAGARPLPGWGREVLRTAGGALGFVVGIGGAFL